ncbi:MAG TPA: SGNH/GDSL hydrolase family protein, partial [Solirubrobacterales bacterium]|nr:SGNH/GDSL hydrolase family protein [Solirubrobacterales bacterium]
AIHTWTDRPLANAGQLRAPDRRKRFPFVHTIVVEPELAAALRPGNDLAVTATARLDADRDGEPESRSLDTDLQAVPSSQDPARLCATPPKRRTRPGQPLVVQLPLCSQAIRWTIAGRPKQGSARIRGGELIYRPAEGFRGTVSIALAGHGAGASIQPIVGLAPVQVTVGAAGSPVVRVFGDSVTAGFGYYEKGEPMPFESLLSCKPGATVYDDACSSNSAVRTNKAEKVEYSADYGLANNVSWAAQWANAHAVTDYKNFAVSGSEPSDWFGKGQFAATSRQIAKEDPDYVLFTMGANPLLSNMLFGVGNIGCGVWADFFGRFQECIEGEFAEIKLHQNLTTLYKNLVRETDAQIFVMQYHLSIPTAALYGVEQIAEMGNLINAEIATVAKEVSPGRITVVSPPHFNVGLALGQAYPSNYKCEGRFFSSVVDGPSVQATPSQTEMGGAHPIEFCAQPKGEDPWVISGDTGIHPSAAGYQQMASQVPAPK